jgi:hypothetical protein
MIRRSLLAVLAALALVATPMAAAVLHLAGGSVTVIDQAVQPSILPAAGAIVGLGPWHRDLALIVEARTSSFDVRHIVVASLRVCRSGPLCDMGAGPNGSAKFGDADHDRVPDLVVPLRPADLMAIIGLGAARPSQALAVSAVLEDGRAISGDVAVDPKLRSDTSSTKGPDAGPSAGAGQATPSDGAGDPAPTAPEPEPDPVPLPSPAASPSATPSPAPSPVDAPTAPAAAPDPRPGLSAAPDPGATPEPTPEGSASTPET